MIFTNEQISYFRTNGWVALPHFWNETEVAAMRIELDRLKAEGLLRNVATAGDGKTESQTKANLQLCPMAPHSTLFRAMPFAPKAVEAIRELIGEPALLHLDQVFLKPAKAGAGTNWHQDNAYFQIEDSLKGTAIWTAVHDATTANGTMRIIPQSFRTLLAHSRDPESNHHIRCFPDEADAVTVELPAGGALFFCYGTPHATGANQTDHERAGVALHYLHAAQNGIAHGGFPVGKRPLVSGAESRGGEEIYGVNLSDAWDTEVRQSVASV